MNKQLKKILSIAGGILFVAFLILLPQILIQSTVKSVDLAVKLKNDVTRKKTSQPPIAVIEPIEKVGFYHFLPGAKTYYLEAIDEEMSCASCTPEIAASGKTLRPKEQVIADAESSGANIISLSDSNSAAVNSYNLSLIELAKKNNFRTTLYHDACQNLATFKKILTYADAAEINLGDTENNDCAKTSGSELSAAQAEIQAVSLAGKHLEISYELNPTNSTTTEINSFLNMLNNTAGQGAIIHFTSADGLADATTSQIIIAARDQALRAGFKYVYTGGFSNPQGENTYCADGTIALSRQDDYLLQNNLNDGKCADGTAIPGIWK
jgi:pyruvate formate lyase activating enzyme